MKNLKNWKNKKLLSKDELKRVKDLATNAFNRIGSGNYRQKLVYNLLNIAKANNQKEFFWVLLRALNSQKDNIEAKKLIKELKDFYPLTSENFER